MVRLTASGINKDAAVLLQAISTYSSVSTGIHIFISGSQIRLVTMVDSTLINKQNSNNTNEYFQPKWIAQGFTKFTVTFHQSLDRSRLDVPATTSWVFCVHLLVLILPHIQKSNNLSIHGALVVLIYHKIQELISTHKQHDIGLVNFISPFLGHK